MILIFPSKIKLIRSAKKNNSALMSEFRISLLSSFT